MRDLFVMFGLYSLIVTSVGIDLKELGGQMSKCLKFCPGLKFKAKFQFSLKNERL